MKNIYVNILILLISVSIVSCEDSDGVNENKFGDNPETGWVEFSGSTFEELLVQGETTSITIPVEINSPINKEDLTISYTIVDVQGSSSGVTASSGTVIIPANSKDGELILNIASAPSISFVLVFDVVLTATDRVGVNVGISDANRPTSYNITVCPSLSSSSGTFLGDYMLTVPSGLSLFGVPVFNDQVVTLVEGSNGPFSRIFATTSYLPAFSGSPESISFTFIDGLVRIDNTVTSTGCGTDIVLTEDSSALLPAPCGDASLTLNMLDFAGGSGSCGVGNVPIQLLITNYKFSLDNMHILTFRGIILNKKPSNSPGGFWLYYIFQKFFILSNY